MLTRRAPSSRNAAATLKETQTAKRGRREGTVSALHATPATRGPRRARSANRASPVRTPSSQAASGKEARWIRRQHRTHPRVVFASGIAPPAHRIRRRHRAARELDGKKSDRLQSRGAFVPQHHYNDHIIMTEVRSASVASRSAGKREAKGSAAEGASGFPILRVLGSRRTSLTLSQ